MSYYSTNRERILQKRKEYYSEHGEHIRETNAQRYWKKYKGKLKTEVFNYYSNNNPCCACCGEDYIEFLSIDHINGRGNEHRKGLSGQNFYMWLRKNNFPDGFRVLCMNCNFSLGHFGYCPHSLTEKEIINRNNNQSDN